MLKKSNCALVYVATGESYILEASLSALFSRPFLDSISICIYTDDVAFAKSTNSFDHIYHLKNPHFSYRDKVRALQDLPFKYCLFLDTDARLVSEIAPVFQMLTVFDLLAVRAPVRYPSGWIDDRPPSLFTEINTGVLFIRRSFLQRLLFIAWLYLYDNLNRRFSQLWDQASFRSCLWFFVSKLGYKFFALPEEVNLRITKPWIAGKGLPVYVVHGRIPEHEWSSFIKYVSGDTSRFRTWNEWLDLYPDSDIKPILPYTH